MPNAAVHDLIVQYQHTFRILYEEIGRFTETDWTIGISPFQTPVSQVMHLLECLDYYSWADIHTPYPWGHRFTGGRPDQAAALAYARELETRIIGQLTPLNDADLLMSRQTADDWRQTVLGHHVYALKHTLHHHGQLAALSVYHGHEGGSWE